MPMNHTRLFVVTVVSMVTLAVSQKLAEEFLKQGAELVKFSLLDVHSGQVK